ncbi:SRPBCC family protein [Devosia aurantiaca]|uniref:SRPBCC family protein n=1 Tax=Devosia aurantiaca TaxID=2714858 RepID=A0A6M1SKJ9_9HYPH|nr:SRPBCC family protein [Devosia aurantiaca]NGP17006.1 SRPBCC family protein [Devosia aurantiaca]
MSDVESDANLEADAHASITIGKPAADLHALWLRPETQSRIWAHFADVRVVGDRTAEWVAKGPAGGEYRWQTLTKANSPNELSWSTLDKADVANQGVLTMRPAPGDRGTELYLDVRFDPPGGIVGKAISKMFHIVPREIVRTALYRFRALALTGEIARTDPQPAGRNGGTDH